VSTLSRRAVRVLWLALPLAACRADPAPEGSESTLGGSARQSRTLPPNPRPEASARAAETVATSKSPAAPAAGESWNTNQIDWQPYDAGLARAKAQHLPVCLVLYTSWCPHCRNYSHVFDDPQVVARAREFVMIRANADDEPALAGKYARDGGYVPRTFFLAPDGALDPEIHAPRPKFLYFLGGMEMALAKLTR